MLHDAGPLPDFERGTAVTIGAFDGVHIGHATLIAETRRLAAELDCPSVLVTLDRHPATVVRPASAPPLLVDETQKFELLAATGIDYVLVVHFDGERSLEGSEEFVREVIVDQLHAGSSSSAKTSTSATGARATSPCSTSSASSAGSRSSA